MRPEAAWRVVLFDLDGTLIDSLADLGQAVNRALAELGHPGHPKEDYRQFIGEGARQLVARALPESVRGDEALVDRALDLYHKHYHDCWHDQTTVYPGIDALLEALHHSGTRLGVISNKPHAFTTLCVEHYFPAAGFDVVFGQREGVSRKPDPAAAIEAARKFGAEPAQCAYVGDAGVDMAFAKAAGMTAIGVEWGFRDRAELLAHGAEHLAADSAALRRLLLGGEPGEG